MKLLLSHYTGSGVVLDGEERAELSSLCIVTVSVSGSSSRPSNIFKPSSNYVLLTVPRWYFFYGSFLLFVFRVCHAVLSAPCSLWSPVGKELTSLLLCV